MIFENNQLNQNSVGIRPVLDIPTLGLISAKELLPHLPIKRSTLWKWVKDGRFPVPLRIGTLTRWKCEDVHIWMAHLITDSSPYPYSDCELSEGGKSVNS